MVSAGKVDLIWPCRCSWRNTLCLAAVNLALDLFKPNHHFVMLLLHICELLLQVLVFLNLLLVTRVYLVKVCNYIAVLVLHVL